MITFSEITNRRFRPHYSVKHLSCLSVEIRIFLTASPESQTVRFQRLEVPVSMCRCVKKIGRLTCRVTL